MGTAQIPVRTLIFKKAKLQEARGQIGCTGAVPRAVGKRRDSRMHLCTCNRGAQRWPPDPRGGGGGGGGTRDFREQQRRS